MSSKGIWRIVPAVVCPLRLDAAALWTLVDDFPRLQLQALHVLFGCVALGDCALKRKKTEMEIEWS